MARKLRLLGDLFLQTVVSSPALEAGSVAADGLSLRFPLGFPVDSLAGTWFEPGHARGPGVGSVFAALGAGSQCADRVGVLEEMTERAGRAGGFHADDAACFAADEGEDVFVGLEDREQTLRLFRDKFRGGCSQLVELRTDLMRYDFSQLIDVSLLEPEMGVAETGRHWGKLAPTERYGKGAYDTGEHG